MDEYLMKSELPERLVGVIERATDPYASRAGGSVAKYNRVKQPCDKADFELCRPQ
jgi:hypothetical protein